MAKIRTIKVEFWTSEQVVSCSIPARLLFIGLWNFCDDGGNHPASCARLKMEIFPADHIMPKEIQKFVNELLHVGLLVEYLIDSESYWHVTGWHHQKIARSFTKFPPPTHPKAVFKQCLSSAQTVFEHCLNANGNGNGNENGINIMSTCSQTDQPVDNLGATQVDPIPSPSLKKYKKEAVKILEFLNEKAERNFPMTKTNLDKIIMRLKSGATAVECRQVIVQRCRKWKADEKMREYLRPKTLFNATNFDNYRGELVLPKEKRNE